MKRTSLLLPFLVGTALLHAANPLDEYLWKKRVLLIATPSLTDPRYEKQAAALLGDLPAIAARDVEVLVAPPGDVRRDRFPLAKDDFLVALVGLDGGVKLARREVLSTATLLKEIDSMPLRRSELKSAERARQKGNPEVAMTATEVKTKFALSTPAAAGGFQAEVHRSGSTVTRRWLFDWPTRPGPLGTLKSDTVLSFLAGDRVEALVLKPDQTSAVHQLGGNVEAGQQPQLVVRSGETISVRLAAGGKAGWALLGSTAAGEEDPTPADATVLEKNFPAHAEWIRATKPSPENLRSKADKK